MVRLHLTDGQVLDFLSVGEVDVIGDGSRWEVPDLKNAAVPLTEAEAREGIAYDSIRATWRRRLIDVCPDGVQAWVLRPIVGAPALAMLYNALEAQLLLMLCRPAVESEEVQTEGDEFVLSLDAVMFIEMLEA